LIRRAETAAKAAEAPAPTASEIAGKLARPDSHATGTPQAAVTLVEFADLQCPSCAAADPQMRQLRRRYGDRVRFVFRQFPLEKVHAYALNAAQASECAAQQGKFWESVERLYAANGDLSDKSLDRYARELALDTVKFRACFSSGETLATIRRDLEDGRALGVRGTPTFFLGRQRIVGTPELAKFEQLLNQELAAVGSAPAPSTTTSAPPTDGKPDTKKPGPKSTPSSTAVPGFLNFQGSSIDCTEDAPKGPEPAMIRTTEAEKLYHDGSVFVDVRSADDYQKARISGAVNVPLNEAERRVAELPRDKTIVLYESGSGSPSDVCAASRAVGRVLLARGYTKVVVYQDGLAGWQKQALPVER
jgi:protein-disulfide isomerase/rhodanese-related sulfurtransferase